MSGEAERRRSTTAAMFRESPALLLSLLLCLPVLRVSTDDDAACLKDFKSAVKDPSGALSLWNFGNETAGYICYFNGVTCWHLGENKVFSLKLPQSGLSGQLPSSFNGCKSTQQLDLSGNGFSGHIPPSLCSQFAYLTNLDLSQNRFDGSIPENLGNCTYLNQLLLAQNQLTGHIPWELARLSRLKDLDLSSNKLSGPIPSFPANISSTSFADNPQLCGPLLGKSCSGSSSSKVGLSIGIAIGVAAAVLLVLGILAWWLLPKRKVKAGVRDEHKWAKRIKAPKSISVSMFEQPLVNMRLSDLMAATNDFSKDNIIGSGRSGTVYKANLADGSVLAIKRLHASNQSENLFKSEMNTLGQVRHRNLVPLLGYCIAGGEKLLVYKHVVNGALLDCLHNSPQTVNLDFITRLKIAIGAARGLAFLHHSCNPRIIHRNISATSILLDEEYEPRIADFGLARLMNPVDTHVSTFVNGDFGDIGYVAPEYVRTLVATVKGDVYSFGVVLLELVTGRRANEVITDQDFRGNLAEWVGYLSNNSRLNEAIETSLKDKGADNELSQFLRIACTCILSQPKERPSMYEVYHLLRSIGQKYNFSDQNDEIPLVDSGDLQNADELIVAPES